MFVTRFYFKHFGFVFGNHGTDSRLVNCRLRICNKSWEPQDGTGLSTTTAMERLRSLVRRVGEDPSGITDKSVKMKGVTRKAQFCPYLSFDDFVYFRNKYLFRFYVFFYFLVRGNMI